MVLPLEGTSTNASAKGFATSLSNNWIITLAQISAGRAYAGKLAEITVRHCLKSIGTFGGSIRSGRDGLGGNALVASEINAALLSGTGLSGAPTSGTSRISGDSISVFIVLP